jgi:hypothetical protein
LALKDLGVDSNPLNLPESPGRDVTATIVPGVDSFLRMGRGRLTAKTSVEYVHFNKSRTQRSFNLSQEARLDMLLNRVVPFVQGGYLRTRQRPNLEIDARVQQNTVTGALGTGLKLGSRFRIELEGRRSSLTFSEGRYGDAAIGHALDREMRLVGWTTKVALTPLTTLVVRAEGSQDRFEFATFRNSDSISLLPGLDFKPSALISGKVSVGYRRFDALDERVPDFGGVIGEVDARYILREATEFAVSATRDVEYSIFEEQPYFVAHGADLAVTQILGLNWFIVGRGGRSRLVYRNFTGLSADGRGGVGRSDRVDVYGFSVGRRFGDDIRASLDVNHARRLSTEPSRRYEGYRIGVSIGYGS